MRTLLFIILFGLFNTICQAQSEVGIFDIRNIYDEKGDYYFDKKEYKKAIVYYNMAYKKDDNNYYSVLRKAEAFTALELYSQASESYQIIFDTDLFIPNEYRLKFALLLLKNKDIKGFEKWMGKYNEIVYTEIGGGTYLSSAEVRAKMYKDSSIVYVENESVLNTAESEICPAIYNDQLVFASTRKKLDGSKGNDFYNIFSARYVNSGQLGKLNVFNKNLNSAQNESAPFFSAKNKSFYFTRSTAQNSNLKTYVSNIPEKLNATLSIKDFTIAGFSSIGHPTFNSKGTMLYFVSEDPGGSGGLDIYSSEFVGGKWSTPKNMGASINTSKDEMYPHVVNDTMLYFTSAGHNGLGGLDLFSINLKQENSSAKNLGNKVNSKFDDYSLFFSPEGLTGYFCSNRPGGFGKEDIYRVQLLDLKVKLAAYRFKRKPFIEDDKINLYLSSGDEYNISSEGNTGFNFGFQPEEGYKMVIQHENPLANDIINNINLSPSQRKKEFLKPKPIQKTEIRLQTGMRYQFTAGMQPLSNEYKKALDALSADYSGASSSAIDLTALAKELVLTEGEIYTIQFVKDDSQYSEKSKEESNLFINNETIPIGENSFFIVLPLDIQSNFNIKTDIGHFKEAFSPKKVGTVKVDASPVYKEVPVKEFEGFPILVNTKSINEVSKKKINAKELTIIPGSIYILSLGKKDPDSGEELEIVVPLTKGVKYNLGTNTQSASEYNKAIAQMGAAKAGESEELIDISVLSKELDIRSDEDIIFNLTPAKKFASQSTGARDVLTTLSVDGRNYFITTYQKLQVNLKLDPAKKVNIQTDLAYVKENFETSTIALDIDTKSFSTDIEEKKKSVITDPVFDVIVVNFNLNEYAIRPDAKSILENKVIKVLKGDSRLYVTIKGYTDALGDAAYNEKLSRNRAQSVKDFLSKSGVGENRIRTFSYGESLSLKDGKNWEDLSEEELQKHRKVEIVIYFPK